MRLDPPPSLRHRQWKSVHPGIGQRFGSKQKYWSVRMLSRERSFGGAVLYCAVHYESKIGDDNRGNDLAQIMELVVSSEMS